MTTFRDPTSVHAQIHKKKSLQFDRSLDNEARLFKPSRLAKRVSIAAFSSVVKQGVSWAGDRLNTYRDGLTREEREEETRRQNRKHVLYLKMRNVRVSRVFMMAEIILVFNLEINLNTRLFLSTIGSLALAN